MTGTGNFGLRFATCRRDALARIARLPLKATNIMRHVGTEIQRGRLADSEKNLRHLAGLKSGYYMAVTPE
jgi:hypothetical protein